MENIDFIYMINLDQRPEKFQSCIEQLHPFDIYPYRFSAVNGRELTKETLNAVGVKFESWMQCGIPGTCYLGEGAPLYETIDVIGRTYFAQSMAKGPIAIVLSHLSILQDAYDAGYETIWIMEDDIEVVQDPRLISNMIVQLDATVGHEEWDILFTDRETKSQEGLEVPALGYGVRPNFTHSNLKRLRLKAPVGPTFRKIGARYGAYSMVIRRSGIKKLLDYFKRYKIFLPYDMDFYLVPEINLYTVTQDIVSTQPKAISDNDAPPLGLMALPLGDDVWAIDKINYHALVATDCCEGWCNPLKARLLISLILMMTPQTVVEIGVFGGKSLIPIAYALKENGQGKVIGIDSWNAEVAARGLHGPDRDWWLSLDYEGIFKNCQKQIIDSGLQSFVELRRISSENASLIHSIDILNIDGNHSPESTYFDVVKWTECVRKGGVIILNMHSNSAVASQWLDEHCVKLGEGPDSQPWGFWIKQ